MKLTKIGKFIAEIRKEHGFTQEQLGEKIGVTNKTVSRWEIGTYLPPADALLTISDYLMSVSMRFLAERGYPRNNIKKLQKKTSSKPLKKVVFL